MESYMDFKNFEDTSQTDDNGWNQTSNHPFARQSSIYSLTFDELQNSLGLPGKEFGSMNMEELLKSIWTAEETHALTSTMGDGIAPNGSLQRQGSLTLPRTLSQKTVDEVWRDVLKETIGVQDVSASGGLNLGPREPTLGEMTLEDFLAKVGVVREDTPTSGGGPTSNGVCSGLPLQNGNNNTGLTTEFQQVPSQNNVVLGNQHFLTSENAGIYTSGVSVTCVASQPQPQPQLQSILPKRTTLAFSSPLNMGNNSPVKGSMAGITNVMDNNVYQNGERGMGGLSNGVTVTQSSPRNSPHCNVIVKGCIDSPTLSPPLPYAFGQVGGRGRKSTASLEKVVERRQRRMIKNRESAARSRARKQAYTLDLEAEVATLKEMNWELHRKQIEILEIQKNQTTETPKRPGGVQSSSLRRTCTGPW